MDIKVETIPTAAKDSVEFSVTFPTIAASVNDKIGSETPEINAGIASLLMCFKLIFVPNFQYIFGLANFGNFYRKKLYFCNLKII